MRCPNFHTCKNKNFKDYKMRGRKPIPDQIKKLKGTFQPCRSRPNALKIRDIINLPEPPRYIQGVAKDLYMNSGLTLLEKGILNSLNLAMFISFCFAVGELHKLEQDIVECRDIEKRAKVLRTWNDLARNVKAWGTEFGLTPASSGKVVMKEKFEKSKMDEYLEKYS